MILIFVYQKLNELQYSGYAFAGLLLIVSTKQPCISSDRSSVAPLIKLKKNTKNKKFLQHKQFQSGQKSI